MQRRLAERVREADLDAKDRNKEQEELEELRNKIFSGEYENPSQEYERAKKEHEKLYRPQIIIDVNMETLQRKERAREKRLAERRYSHNLHDYEHQDYIRDHEHKRYGNGAEEENGGGGIGHKVNSIPEDHHRLVQRESFENISNDAIDLVHNAESTGSNRHFHYNRPPTDPQEREQQYHGSGSTDIGLPPSGTHASPSLHTISGNHSLPHHHQQKSQPQHHRHHHHNHSPHSQSPFLANSGVPVPPQSTEIDLGSITSAASAAPVGPVISMHLGSANIKKKRIEGTADVFNNDEDNEDVSNTRRRKLVPLGKQSNQEIDSFFLNF